MSLLHDFREPVTADTAPMRFRAPTIEQALTEARAELGPDVEVVDANRIRRGGVGGFFATDLGVELTIRPIEHGSGPTPPAGTHDSAPIDDRISSDFEARLALLDRAIFGEEPASGIDRLVDKAAGDDGFRRGANRVAGDGSFADHLARELSADRPLPRRAERDAANASTAIPAASPAAVDSGLPRRAAQTPASRLLSVVEAAGRIGSAAPEQSATVDCTVASVDEDRTIPLPRASHGSPAIAPSQTPSRPHELARPAAVHHADLAAGAVGRLITELARVAPASGSRVNQLSRLTVSLTASDGSAIEFAAELNGFEHG